MVYPPTVEIVPPVTTSAPVVFDIDVDPFEDKNDVVLAILTTIVIFYPNAIENANAVATACNIAFDVAALALEFEEMESLKVTEPELAEIVIVLVVVLDNIVTLLPATILNVSVGDVARINELLALIVAKVN